jgi:hypothetical protein
MSKRCDAPDCRKWRSAGLNGTIYCKFHTLNGPTADISTAVRKKSVIATGERKTLITFGKVLDDVPVDDAVKTKTAIQAVGKGAFELKTVLFAQVIVGVRDALQDPITQLQTLSLYGNALTGQYTQILAAGLAVNKTLLSLNLKMCCLVRADILVLARALAQNSTLTQLNLSSSNLSGDTVMKFAEILSGTDSVCKLQHLDLSFCKLSAQAAPSVAQLIKSLPSLKTLNVKGNTLKEGSSVLVEVAVSAASQLEGLDLSTNGITDPVTYTIAQRLREGLTARLQGARTTDTKTSKSTQPLQFVGLTSNNLGENGAFECLSVMDDFPSLKRIDMRYNDKMVELAIVRTYLNHQFYNDISRIILSYMQIETKIGASQSVGPVVVPTVSTPPVLAPLAPPQVEEIVDDLVDDLVEEDWISTSDSESEERDYSDVEFFARARRDEIRE